MNKQLLEFPPGEKKILLQGPAGNLETLTSTPPKIAKEIVAIICHPHPLFGGTMHNKVVYTLARAFKELGLYTVRFNFRGVGESEGSYDKGAGEAADLLAIIEWVQRVKPNASLWLAGFSFGAYVATRGADNTAIKQLITVAPPVRSFEFEPLPMPSCPWLVIQGEQDTTVLPTDVYTWLATIQPPPHLIKIPHADHFFHGKLIELRESLIKALENK